MRLSRQGWTPPYHTNGPSLDLGCHLGNRAGENVGYWSGGINDAQLNTTVKFMTGPKKMSDLRRMDVLWFLLNDQIHHRGQFSVYLRMAGAKVPSIYGPSKDEPWQ